MSVSPTDLAWLAGFVDGEGTIGLYRKRSYFGPEFSIGNTDIRAMNKAASVIEFIVGKKCRLYVSQKGSAKHKACWGIYVNRQVELRRVLRSILPYLVSKKEQAEEVLAFADRRAHLKPRHQSLTSEIREKDEVSYLSLRSLNKRGASADEGSAVVNLNCRSA